MVWSGRGGGVACAEKGRSGWVLGGGQGSQRGPGSYASHKLYNIGRVPVFINLNWYTEYFKL